MLAHVGPSWPQVGPKLAPCWPMLAQVGPSWPKLAQVGPKVGPSWPKLVPRWPQVGPCWLMLAPSSHAGSPALGSTTYLIGNAFAFSCRHDLDLLSTKALPITFRFAGARRLCLLCLAFPWCSRRLCFLGLAFPEDSMIVLSSCFIFLLLTSLVISFWCFFEVTLSCRGFQNDFF